MTVVLTREEVLARRLAAQHLSTPGLPSAAAVVDALCCVQSQEWAHGFWSLGMRTAGLDCATVRAEFDSGAILRTHVLRPTWHFLRPGDLGWLLRLTAPRVHQRNAGTYRRLGLDSSILERAAEVMLAALRRTALTRTELAAVLAAEGLPTNGMALAHLVMWAELEALICSGPIRGAQHTYVRVDERIDPTEVITPADPLTELARRFLIGHGPSTAADLARWSSLTLTDARTAMANLGDESAVAEVATEGGTETVRWLAAADDLDSAPDLDPDRVWWLPLYDELPLSHPAIGFRPLQDHPHRPGDDVFTGSLVAGADNLGLWKRTVRGRDVELATWLAPGVGTARRDAAHAEGLRLADFLGKTPVW